ncbi:hypothetical protein GCM10010517_57190 [Streptosporangium fragile]|uniref:Uncharacterized protein n=1 Tax=Streptosporangium fragile TaxID=46186 RepID=A0ABP6IMJ3_9ACTN
MAVPDSVDPAARLAKQIETGDPDLLRSMVKTTAEGGAGWPAFLRSLVARDLSGVQPVVSDARAGPVQAVDVALPGASWQR